MKLLKLLFVLAIGGVLLVVALSNREPVVLRLLPDSAAIFGRTFAVQMPLFLAVFGGVLIGLLVGLVWEWMREAAIRARAAEKTREVARLEREVSKLRANPVAAGDDVLALLNK